MKTKTFLVSRDWFYNDRLFMMWLDTFGPVSEYMVIGEHPDFLMVEVMPDYGHNR